MLSKFAALLLATGLAMGNAQACSRAFAIDLEFAPDSATLEKAEIIKLAAWLDKWRKVFSRFESVDVDGIAPATAKNPKALAKRRSEATVRAVQMLLDGVPVHASSHLNPPSSTFKGGNYAAIDLVPFQSDLSDCNPVPIPGFKR